MVDLECVGKKFDNHTAVNNITLTMHKGCIYGLCGRNGAGKTTLLKIISGILPPDSGTVKVFGKNPTKDWLIRRQIGIVQEEDTYFPELTAWEFLWWVGRLRQLTDIQCKEQIKRLAHAFYFEKNIDDLIESFSYGMRRKVLVASAFIAEPKLLLLDEPTNGLDYASIEFLCELLAKHQQKEKIAIIASHNWEFVKSVCSNVIIFVEGRIAKKGLAENVNFYSSYKDANSPN